MFRSALPLLRGRHADPLAAKQSDAQTVAFKSWYTSLSIE
jgi:hypothetical protein